MKIQSNLVNVNWSNQYVSLFPLFYYKKLLTLFIWILIYTVFSGGMFLDKFCVSIITSLLMVLWFSKSLKDVKNKAQQIFFHMIFFCILPTGFSIGYYVVGIVLISLLIEVVFKHYDGFLFHPSLFVYTFFVLISVFGRPEFFAKVETEYSLYTNLFSFIVVDTNQYLSLIHTLYSILGVSSLALSKPSIVVMGVLMTFFKRDRSLLYLFSIRYLVGILFFTLGLIGIYSIWNPMSLERIHQILIYNFFHSPVFFIALFIVPESLVSVQSVRGKKNVIYLACFLTSLCLIYNIPTIGAFLSIFIAQLMGPIFYYSKTYQKGYL